MKLLVVGAGAIGQWIGANVQRAGAEVVFVGREKFAQAASRDGLHVQLPDGNAWHLPQVRTHASMADAASDAPFDAIALCMKAYAVEEALREIVAAGVLAPHTCVMSFQNGIGTEAMVVRLVGSERVIAGTLTSAVSLIDATTVKQERAKGGVGLAILSPLPKGEGLGVRATVGGIVHAFIAAPLLHTTVFTDANAMKWSKLLLNLVGNATSAMYRRRVAELLADDFTAQIEMQQLREAERVMRAAGIRTVNLPGAPAQWFARAIRLLPDALLRWTLQRFFAQARGDKWPSFYYDAVHQTGRSEVNWLNGAVSEWGRRLNVPTPVNDELTRKVIDAVHGREQNPRF